MALVAAVVGVAAARIAGAFVPDVSETAALGEMLFEIGVQAIATALAWPYADELIPPPASVKDADDEDI